MIRVLRRRFILIAMASLTGTLVFLCVSICLGNYLLTTSRADMAIGILYQNGGEFPLPDTPVDPAAYGGFQITQETPFETRYFIVHLTEKREVAEVDTEHLAALDRQMMVDSVVEILEEGKTSGYTGYYRYRVFENDSGGSTIIVMDCFLQLQAFNNVLRVTLLVSLACIIIVFLLLLFFSKKAIRPFVENLERQRQFVTDASHELKTPLAIIAANTGLLEATMGKNRWLDSTQEQVGRLDQLVKNLIELARTEESIQEYAACSFSLSDMVESIVDAFRSLAEADGKKLESQIESGLSIRGVEENLFRLCSILLDNAVKYCDSDVTIHVTLGVQGRGLTLVVSNPCADVNPAQIPRFFDRFYRSDTSRSRATGGYGIGLSTAKAIVTRHKGRLSAHYAGGVISFTVSLPGSAVRQSGYSSQLQSPPHISKPQPLQKQAVPDSIRHS